MNPLHKSIVKSITPRTSKSLSEYFKEVGKYQPPTPEEERELFVKIRAGDNNARDELIKRHLRFTISIAKQYLGFGLAFEDLLSEAANGLIIAIDKYDPNKQTKFLTYAVWWIRKTIIDSVLNLRDTIRLPQHISWQKNKMNNEVQKYTQEFMNDPSDDYLEQAGYKVSALNSVPNTRVLAKPADSSEEDLDILDVFTTEDALPDEQLQANQMMDLLDDALARLKPIERGVITSLFGIGKNKESVSDVAKEFNIKPSVVLNIKKSVISKLRKELVDDDTNV